jgi:hypothetical protein
MPGAMCLQRAREREVARRRRSGPDARPSCIKDALGIVWGRWPSLTGGSVMADLEMTYDEVLVALGDIVASEARVQIYISGQAMQFVAGFGGQLHRVDGPFLDELRPMYVANGGDADLVAFFIVDDGGRRDGYPCFVICRSFFEAASAVQTADLEHGEAAGLFWRALMIFVGGVALNIGVEAAAEVD